MSDYLDTRPDWETSPPAPDEGGGGGWTSLQMSLAALIVLALLAGAYLALADGESGAEDAEDETDAEESEASDTAVDGHNGLFGEQAGAPTAGGRR